MPSIELLQAVAVTAELCGRTFTEGAARVFVEDLAGFPEQAVLRALARCRREVKGILTIQDVVSRVDDGRPGPEEAWAQMPFDESQSVVWTDEMANAFGVARGLLDEGEKVAARMAFKEAYIRLVGEARDAGRPVSWSPSLGYDANGRDAVLADAVAKGRLTYEHAQDLSPMLPAPTANILALAGSAIRRELPGAAA
jgi:hypothetical protein